jgi:hypothetical protein
LVTLTWTLIVVPTARDPQAELLIVMLKDWHALLQTATVGVLEAPWACGTLSPFGPRNMPIAKRANIKLEVFNGRNW